MNLEFRRTSPSQWQADFVPQWGEAVLASLIPEIQSSGQSAPTRGRRIPIATPISAELLPPMDSPRRLREFVRETGGMVLDPEIVSFPHQLEPLDSEERRVTWALVLLAIGSIAIAIWYRRRVGS